jgi:hypothetical protein
MILMPAKSAGDWQDPLAARWQPTSGFPPEIAALLGTHPATKGAALLLAVPEHRVPLAGGVLASPTDLWGLARARHGLLSIVVERKVADAAGPTGGDSAWEPSSTEKRWQALCDLLEIRDACVPAIRSQLFHRTATALLEARRFFARGAAVIVHSFSAAPDSFVDFARFVALMGGRIDRPGQLAAVAPREGIELFFGWATPTG